MTDSRDQEKHKQRQQKLKSAVDEKIAAASDEKRILLVLTGNGKGKSTAGFGTILRAVGHKQQAAVVQFIKGMWECGERNVLESLGVPFYVMNTGFTWETQNRDADTQAAQKAWQAAQVFLTDPNIDIVLLDELTYMLSYHYLDVEQVIEALENRPAHQHVVITGRSCHRKILDLADTVSDIQPVKHAFDNGIKAQVGLDY